MKWLPICKKWIKRWKSHPAKGNSVNLRKLEFQKRTNRKSSLCIQKFIDRRKNSSIRFYNKRTPIWKSVSNSFNTNSGSNKYRPIDNSSTLLNNNWPQRTFVNNSLQVWPISLWKKMLNPSRNSKLYTHQKTLSTTSFSIFIQKEDLQGPKRIKFSITTLIKFCKECSKIVKGISVFCSLVLKAVTNYNLYRNTSQFILHFWISFNQMKI